MVIVDSNPALEMVLADHTQYAITINIATLTGNLTVDVESYFKLFKALCKHCDIGLEVYPELSKTGRLHYHGIVHFAEPKDIAQFYHNMWHKTDKQKMCNILIKPINDLDQWIEYIDKQVLYMKPLFEFHLLRYKWTP